jgi:heme-degrading monooxygenase HmoA
MYARINYVDIKPDRFAEIDGLWRGAVSGYAGLVRGYFLRDGNTAHTLSVILFETEAQMRENTAKTLSQVVRQAADYRLNDPELHHLEACAHVPPAGGGDIGFARAARVTLKPERLAEVVAGWPGHVSAYRSEPGFRGAYLLCDRKSGASHSVSFWRSEQDVRENERSGAFQATVDPYRDMIAVPPTRSYWAVRLVVEPQS